ncbi:MAG: cation diffusion facilitator family transporter [Bacteroidales bacterium]|nr:cation diffusion facilitator family transporter [Bacteroidales bacterium]
MEHREKGIFRVTLIGSVVNVALTAFKFVAGILGSSAAMVADAVHSLSDLLTDFIVLVFVRISSKPRDKGHDFGHGKYETLATTIIGLALLAVAAGIVVSGIKKIVLWAGGEAPDTPGMLAFWAAIISIILKEAVFRYSIFEGRRLDSSAVVANAWHHRSDALSSIGTAVGIGFAAILGGRWTVLDPAAGVVVGIFIAKVAVDLLKEGISELMEASLPDETEDEIIRIVSSVPDVSEPHELRTRRVGKVCVIDIHVMMDGNSTLYESHERADAIEDALKERFGQDTIVSVHMEPKE